MFGRRCVVRVPASSANLGPGFDVLAAALSLHLEVEVAHTGRFGVLTELKLPRDRRNLVVRAFERLHPADEYEFRIESEIPLSGGLGSSAAAIVAGLLAAAALADLDVDVLDLATKLEGHSDNVAAALEGGFVICEGGRAHRFTPPAELEALLVVPGEPVPTRRARAALPAMVPIGDAVYNVSRASTLVLGLLSGERELIAAGLGDRLHQPHRAHLYPRSSALLERAAALGALGATISGAGPTVLVWSWRGESEPLTERLRAEAEGWATVLPVSFDRGRAELLEP